jgi:CheY-like chemotaxis protein
MGQAQQKSRAVLIVEDDAELRGLTAALLEDGNLDTIECSQCVRFRNTRCTQKNAEGWPCR